MYWVQWSGTLTGYGANREVFSSQRVVYIYKFKADLLERCPHFMG